MRIKVDYGEFPGDIPYAKFGRGAKNLLYLIGGPGNEPPRGLSLNMYASALSFLSDKYTVWMTTRRRGQPEGYGTRKMAADTAHAIKKAFGGRVDAVMGLSFGGMIAQYLAADHPGLAGCYLLVSTGLRVPQEIVEMDRRYAEHLAAGKSGRAYYTIAGYLASPGLKTALMRISFFLIGSLFKEKHHPDFAADTLQEARMESAHDAGDSLARISDPVLMIGGDSDLCFPRQIQKETASAIPGAELILYPGRGHMDVTTDKRFAQDVKDFLPD